MTVISRYVPARFRRSVIAPRFIERLKQSQTVVGGPFKGMRYHGKSVCGAALPKAMGVYEYELAPFLLKWSAIPFQRIINIGAGEGYYAVGCARLWPRATITAFETGEEGRALLARNVDLNGLQSRVRIMGHCGRKLLQAAISDGQQALVIADVEGAEGQLLDPDNIPGLVDAHIIVEIHDFVDDRLGQTVVSQLKSSHTIEEVHTQRRRFADFQEPRALWLRLWLLPYLKQYADEFRPGPMRWFCCAPVTRCGVPDVAGWNRGAVRYPAPDAATEIGVSRGGDHNTESTARAQRKALTRKFALGLLRPFSGLNVSVRLGEIARSILSRWPVPTESPKPTANFRYLTLCDRGNWLMLRESLLSLYRSSSSLPKLTVVSDGSWTSEEFAEVFAWWPAPITVLQRDEVSQAASSAGFPELAKYAGESPYGLKLSAIVTQAIEQPVLFVDADILWFRDPMLLLGDPLSWGKPRALRESNCHQSRDMALQYCAQVLEPPFVNSGIVALHGELIAPELLRSMVQEALPQAWDSRCEQTIVATAVKLGGQVFPDELCFVGFDDAYRFRSHEARSEGYYSRHYVNWMRHMLYRDALKLRFRRL